MSIGSGRPASVKMAALGGGPQQAIAPYTEYGQAPGAATPSGSGGVSVDPGGKTMTLQFVNADIQDFAKSVFDDVLHEPVIIDPNLQGKITVRSGEPVDKASAIDIVRQMLEMNGAQLSKEGKVWRITSRGMGAPRSAGAARIVPLRNVDAEQARAAVQAFAGGNASVAALPGNGGLVLSGDPQQTEPLAQFVASLDVDQMKGQSFALIPLREAGAAAVSKDMQQVFAAAGKNFQAIAVPRMNAILVIASSAAQIQRARQWAGRLDRANQDEGRVFVYPVQNRRAADLAVVLRQMFGAGGGGQEGAGGAVSPAFQTKSLATPASLTTGGPANGQEAGAAPAEMEGNSSRISIQADMGTNSLVVTASPVEWRTVSSAISRLDVQPTQVLIEATIAEVALNNDLRYGVRWYFQTGNHSFGLSDLDKGNLVAPSYPGGNYSFSVPSARVVLNALESVTNVEVISSPALTVLDNQTASLKVGDQVPIATRSSQGVTNPDAPILNDIQLKDTGIILSVTPRVNASGLVQLDISQEVSDVVPTTTSTLNSPTIQQRKIDTSVAVGSGAEIVLGGLIKTKREKGNGGIPILKDIPILGNAFRTGVKDLTGRTELLIILRPTVMGSRADVEAVTQAVRASMSGADRAIGRRYVIKK
ncbi:type II secretion system secretin GspD [Labrys sp. 22185]|uniref:type II secretion system secretin GspD n=1 Tax=Labrys sp. 22185 TaxID=3453888 RepID=UPI003F8242D2